MATTVIEIQGLQMSYGSLDAVRRIDLEVHAGEVFAFLGPNGAGKTTTVEILERFWHRSASEVCALGEDRPRRAVIGGLGSAWSFRSPNPRPS